MSLFILIIISTITIIAIEAPSVRYKKRKQKQTISHNYATPTPVSSVGEALRRCLSCGATADISSIRAGTGDHTAAVCENDSASSAENCPNYTLPCKLHVCRVLKQYAGKDHNTWGSAPGPDGTDTQSCQ